MTSILESPMREIMPAINAITDVPTLAALGQQERAGAARVGVLNAIQGRIGAVMLAQGPADPGGTVEDLLDMPGNREMVANGEQTAIVSGKVTTNHPARVPLWFKGLHAYMPRLVAAGGVAEAIRAGAFDYCPDCGMRDCGLLPDGRPSGNVNACPARENKVAFSRCPVCSKRVFDPGAAAMQQPTEDGEIVVESYGNLPPEARIKARAQQHILAYHPEEASAYGITPQTPRDRIAGSAPARELAV